MKVICFVVAVSICSVGVHAQLVGGPYAIRPLDINGGGTTSTGGPYSISASTGQAGGVGTITAEPVPAPPLYQFDDGFWSTITDPPTTPLPDPSGVNRNRYISFSVPPSSGGSGPLTALRVTLVDLQNPVPPNLPQFPPPDFSAYESATCTAPGEANGCVRWVGKPGSFLESQDIPGLGSFRGARLQCTPDYRDWNVEGVIHVTGAEIVPSSIYHVQSVSAACMGQEPTCTAVSTPAQITTTRSGDITERFNPPDPSTQPDALDVAQVVNKVKQLAGALPKAIAQLQPNLPELNADVNALDIVAVVDAVKQKAYAFSGPCPCPSTVTCGSVSCSTPGTCVSAFGSEALCVKTCSGPGPLVGDPCINNSHCVGSGTCENGFCRDRCGRCTP